jgi:hypothetical protein
MKNIIIIFTTLFFTTSCLGFVGGRNMSWEEVAREVMKSWIGSHISKVEKSWGYPTKKFKATTGRDVYLWSSSVNNTTDRYVTQDPYCNDRRARAIGCSQYSIEGGQTIRKFCDKHFETDSNGIIVYGSAEGNACDEQFKPKWVPDEEKSPESNHNFIIN